MERKSISKIMAVAAMLAAAVALAGCSKVGNGPFSKSKDVRISVAVESVLTRTAFGEEATGQVKVNWLVNDRFTVYSDKAKHLADGRSTADYYVTERNVTPGQVMKDRALVNPVDPNGLQWPETGPASFYARYPASETSMSATKMSATIPAAPAVTWTSSTVTDPSTSQSTTTTTGVEDMAYAFMFAKAVELPNKDDIILYFYPKYTAFEFEVDCGDNESITLSSFTFGSSSQPVAGRYELAYADEAVTALDTDAKRITVDLTGKVLTKGNIMKITVFALPQNLTNLEISFSGTEIGTRRLKLAARDGTSLNFAACKLHRIKGITIPKLLDAGGEYIEWDQEVLVEPIHWDN